jgi:L-fuconolactonase
MIIDSHHHFWSYSKEEYAWISDEMAVLRRDFLPADLANTIAPPGVDAVVSVQARQSTEETRWLLKLAAENDFVKGVVGWAPLTDPRLRDTLDLLHDKPKLKALRHVLQGEPDDHYMLRKDFNSGISLLHDYGLAYDILIYQKHLPQTLTFVD